MNQIFGEMVPVPKVGFDAVCQHELCESESGKVLIFCCRHCETFLCQIHKKDHVCKQRPLFEPLPTKTQEQLKKDRIEVYYRKFVEPDFQARGYIKCQSCDTWHDPRFGHCRCAVVEVAG